MIITIDGPVATGKTTIAKLLAERIGFIYIETGAMYRCATIALLHSGVSLDDEKAVAAVMDSFQFDMRLDRGECRYFFLDEDITLQIRGHVIADAVSKVSALPAVRHRLVELQRQMAEGLNAVFEGRDMGSVVFPNAYLKVFLTGNDDVRALRRYGETCRRFPEEARNLTLDQVKKEMLERDAYDMSRVTSPLIQPDGALVIDTSALTVDEVVQAIIDFKDSMTVAQEGLN